MFNMGSAPSLSDIAAVTKDGNGAAYDSWSDARKHYTKTGSSEDKERMEERGKEHVEKAIISMRDIWSEASPELKRAMKTELSTLVDNMTI